MAFKFCTGILPPGDILAREVESSPAVIAVVVVVITIIATFVVLVELCMAVPLAAFHDVGDHERMDET